MNIDRRAFIAGAASSVALASETAAQAMPALRPEDFGARGDGTTNDTRAFTALSAQVTRRGGGTILLGRGRTYLVGDQRRGGKFGWTGIPVLDLNGLTRPVRLLGNGARLRCQPGLKFGTFDPATDQPVRRKMPNSKRNEVASPYWAIIWIRGARAPVEIRDLELDGSLERLQIGGPFGDTGWQVPATGLMLQGNVAEEIVDNVYTHHHGQDGAMIIGNLQRSARSRLTRLISRYNGRQGLSVTAGRGYDFADCEFSHTGRSAIRSAPGAGVDIEAQTQPIRDLTFTRCTFADNSGAAMVADSGDSADVRFSACKFVGTTTWSAWPKKPGFRFDGCTFVGAVTHPFPDKDPARAARFTECRFTDDPSLSPTGKVFHGAGPIVNMGQSTNVVFDRCRFELVGKAVLPWSWKATYQDCTMSQVSPRPAMTKGRYRGRTTIKGPVSLHGSMIEGTLILNGKQVPRGPVGVPPW